MFPGFTLETIEVAADVRLRVRVGGAGPAVVLLHGHPRTHTTWHLVAPRLVDAGFIVVCPDLRGYGGSTAPPPRRDHAQASKRAMAADVVEVMEHLDRNGFAVVGHDRGSYVALRLALAQPDLPERVILADPDAWYGCGPDREVTMGAENYADFYRAVHDPVVVRAMLEDYRAGLGVDRAHDDHDRADGRRVSCPTLVCWSSRDDLEELYGDPVDVWRPWASDLSGQRIDSGHHMAEENPGDLSVALLAHLGPA